jgi:WD40 repeat protein
MLFSGSADMTIRLWNLETGAAAFSFSRHGGTVSAMAFGSYQSSEFLFSGGLDRIVHAWDVTRKKGMCQIDVGEGQYPASLYFNPEHKQLSIVALPSAREPDMDEREALTQVGQLQVYTFKKA